MKKGITLRVQVYIEGEDEPAHDFSATGKQVVTQVLQQGFKAYQGPYTIKVQKVDPVEGGDDDADSESGGDALDQPVLLAYTPSTAAPSQPAAPSAAPPTPTPPPASAPQAATPPAAPAPPAGAPQPPATPSQATPPHQQPEKQPPEKHHFWER